jgi:predicted amidophosphoribosyltransferase
MPPFADRLRAAASVLTELERWLLPPACLLCQAAVPAREGDALVCGLCVTRWRRLVHPLCARCGQPRLLEVECRICAAWPPGLERARSAVWLDGGAREAAHQLKYGGWSRLAAPMAEVMRGLEPLTGRVCLIPIPLGARRLAERGYNQSERLAAALAERIGGVVRPDLLRRVRDTRSQTALTPEARQANVADAFEATGAPPPGSVLVDDVFTTGATLCSAAAALRAAGAERVEAVTFARAGELV